MVRTQLWGLLLLLLGAPLWAGDYEHYVGAQICGQCHQKEYEIWKQTKHASATEALPEQHALDVACNGCHTMSQVDERFSGVQCESCHGAGHYYSKSFVMRDAELARLVGLLEPTAEACEHCHTQQSPSVKPFSYAEKWALIAHGSQGGAPSSAKDSTQ